ncbi:MAG TPA: hypothetical protein VLM41_06050, partial [Steroidobacteraceae bacterium]|nr:hypothetical protein [Steroidobacteraceae bacterium]
MSTKSNRSPGLSLIGGLSLALVVAPAVADIPDNLTDIPYQSTEWGSEQLRFRGYTRISSDHHNGKRFEYWWQASSLTCIQARASEGRYEALKITSATDCNQYHKEAVKNDNSAAIAIGAAALIGAAVLAHQSHERDEKHGQDSKSVSEFDRGYRDGLHHQAYHNYQNSPAYSDGYNAGQRQRYEQTSYRPYDGRYSGYHPFVSVDDLVGIRASSADSELRSRGFTDTG